MKSLRIAVLSCLACFAPLLHAADGQCFIATKGGGSVKLALVEVLLLAKDEVKAYKAKNGPILNQKIADYKREFDRVSRIMNSRKSETDVYLKGVERLTALTVQITNEKSRYFRDLKAPILAATKSDADGRFKIDIEGKPPFYLFARGQRLVGEKVEHFVWLIEDKNFGPPYFLSNDNAETWLSLPK